MASYRGKRVLKKCRLTPLAAAALLMVLVMSVEPGFGGQKFMPGSLDKIRLLRKEINRLGLDCLIEIDGGVNLENAAMIAAAGTDVLVAGSAVFGAPDPAEAVRMFKEI